SVRIRGGERLHAIEGAIPGDISSAAFFMCAAAVFSGSRVTFPGLLLNPTGARLLGMLTMLGGQISIQHVGEEHGELGWTMQIEGNQLRGLVIAGADTAALIDELPVLAAIAPYMRDGIEVRDARELRVKESDRIAVVAENLRAMGAAVEEREDGLRVAGGQA